MKNNWLKIFYLISLAASLLLAWLTFRGRMTTGSFKLWFLVVSVVYFIAAAISVSRKSRN